MRRDRRATDVHGKCFVRARVSRSGAASVTPPRERLPETERSAMFAPASSSGSIDAVAGPREQDRHSRPVAEDRAVAATRRRRPSARPRGSPCSRSRPSRAPRRGRRGAARASPAVPGARSTCAADAAAAHPDDLRREHARHANRSPVARLGPGRPRAPGRGCDTRSPACPRPASRGRTRARASRSPGTTRSSASVVEVHEHVLGAMNTSCLPITTPSRPWPRRCARRRGCRCRQRGAAPRSPAPAGFAMLTPGSTWSPAQPSALIADAHVVTDAAGADGDERDAVGVTSYGFTPITGLVTSPTSAVRAARCR